MIEFNKAKGLSRTLLGLSCVFLTSCALTETDVGEKELYVDVPSSYGQTINEPSSRANLTNDTRLDLDPSFYKKYRDPKLDAVIEKALAVNYDIRSAYINLKKAEVNLSLTSANMHPTVNASLSSSSRKDLSSGDSPTSKSSSANLGISYELDLFGRLDAAERASWQQFKASAYDYKAMRLTVVQKASQYYWNYAYAKEALSIAKEQLASSQSRLALIKSKMENGAADRLEYDKAMVNNLNVEQSVYQSSYELTAAHNALTTLLGLNPDTDVDSMVKDMSLETTRNPYVDVALPATLLQNRPDLMAYEARLRSAYASIDEADANFYPSFNLSGSVTTGNGEGLTKFFTDPIGALGAAITLPFFNYNELSLKKDSALLDRDKAKLDFVDGYIKAVTEVADALNSMSYQEQLIKSARMEYTLTKSNYAGYEERYRYGSASLSDMLDAADSLNSAQVKLLGCKRDLLNASMSLMIALGGGSFNDDSATAKITPNESNTGTVTPVSAAKAPAKTPSEKPLTRAEKRDPYKISKESDTVIEKIQ